MLDELDIAPRTSGRANRAVMADCVRELRESDLVMLEGERGIKPQPIAKIGDRHHALARCLAQGMKLAEASAITGYSVSRISILSHDPSFKELVTHYQANESSAFGEFVQRATTLTLSAINELSDRLEDQPEDFSTGQLLEVSKTFADRIGHAPVQRQVQTNINIELGSRMAAARARVAKLTDARVIEGQLVVQESAA